MKHVHFIGIGGAGTSGLAEVLLARGVKVSGSDLAFSAKTKELIAQGASVTEGHNAENIAEDVDTVIYSSAVKKAKNVELEEAKQRGIRTVRRADFMGELLERSKTIAVAGTHGKTTTTSMIASILIEAKSDPLVFVGASVKELDGRNARAGKGPLAVVEADEYDRSFLALKPYIAVMTTLEAEHLDIYRDLDDLKETFVQFANQRSKHDTEGFAVICLDESNLRAITPKLEKKIVTYGLSSPEAKYKARDIQQLGAKLKATITRGGEVIGELDLGVPGEHNLKNALAAIAVAEILAIPFEVTKKALKKFGGAERRFQVKGEVNGVLVIDDYAHHPTEIEATLSTVKQSFPGRRVIACFQPHTFTRTRDFSEAFGQQLAKNADKVLLLDIYPAREQPIEGVTSQLIVDASRAAGNADTELVSSLEDLPSHIGNIAREGDIILTIGAGTITDAAPLILKTLANGSKQTTNAAPATAA
ncbi:MAG TPA: UDP-N-acetylmuramate--L-alanine ligase [Candidatus Kapabacteria bacterium]|nr:UDP-N-acetylmuramate--L-alanine ligase [Candidatus Kapabacteria bacterium]